MKVHIKTLTDNRREYQTGVGETLETRKPEAKLLSSVNTFSSKSESQYFSGVGTLLSAYNPIGHDNTLEFTV